MGAGFTRRFTSVVGTEVITQIEGVVILDLPPPGSVSGVGTGTTAIVGEFADMTFAVAVDTSGNVTTSAVPVELFSSQDMINKVGGFDETLGDTGAAGGNGFIALRNKKFSRIIAVPINLCSSKGVRLFRDLPTNTSATVATPVVLLQAATVVAGREFKLSGNRVRTGARKTFTATGAYASGVDGAVTTAGAPAATQTFNSAGSTFLTINNGGPVTKGDILVLGVIGGAGALGANAFTFRVNTTAASDTALVVEKLDGSSFDWTTGTAQPFRVHPSTDADTGGANSAANAGGYIVPARPLDATIAAVQTLAPSVVPTAGTATTWDPLSGLSLRTIPTTGLVYTATIQAPNAVNDATIDALYSLAVASMLTDASPASEINILFSARHSSTITSGLKAHVLSASAQALGRVACISPPLTTLTTSAATADAAPGVGANRAERVIYNWPGAQTFIPEAVGFSLKDATATARTDGLLDTHFDAWCASVLSNLAPERNPGQAADPVATILAPVLGVQHGVANMVMADYVALRSKGIAALRMDRAVGPIIQSGVTTSLTSGQKNINRRRMADFLEDSLAGLYADFVKLPLTNSLKDAIVGETNAFLIGMQSPNNPPAQRIVGFVVDPKSGNTPELEAQGIFVVVVKVRTLATADFIVLQASIGESVDVSST